jgi:hypothetical protein
MDARPPLLKPKDPGCRQGFRRLSSPWDFNLLAAAADAPQRDACLHRPGSSAGRRFPFATQGWRGRSCRPARNERKVVFAVACARDVVAAFWDDVVRDALAGGEPHRTVPVLRRWFDGYRGSGRGAVTTSATPEPFIGALRVGLGMPRLVALGLNPGRADISLQGPGGVFACEYKKFGGLSAWAVTEPFA